MDHRQKDGCRQEHTRTQTRGGGGGGGGGASATTTRAEPLNQHEQQHSANNHTATDHASTHRVRTMPLRDVPELSDFVAAPREKLARSKHRQTMARTGPQANHLPRARQLPLGLGAIRKRGTQKWRSRWERA
eukprot:2361200-Rhodomonas_salina.2